MTTDYRMERINKMIQVEECTIAAQLREVTVGPELVKAEIRKECLDEVKKALPMVCKRCSNFRPEYT
jgi:hypothetical protein